ncbi:PREDICTED: cGMP-dependent protein kinase, isozyme 2 forms cD4/T1/T3A/T3B-like [Nicrophorus vespilloides]|uniref:cGMP-dependent protein kinase, isozyme 2 forms cD4/T1/T3A/T3B-like n=1 Tax=Nicrophorus vespilloides TaxID=110193 RepID=A0ABM1NGB5_NICVS|nr:PREDICTED: cGMP-dependent protein kinase, isozyme 2 forms cD4/T1/T3A/T3B-like [Nicrophorus vespilloides]XP_017785865.1 PREDICTED: cGMP-dependent protein kinase, isozyme 2 forms cD4/T1/T3A/T3B-like [Nicrophorus vespilloides]
MRVCLDTLCFSSWLSRNDEEAATAGLDVTRPNIITDHSNSDSGGGGNSSNNNNNNHRIIVGDSSNQQQENARPKTEVATTVTMEEECDVHSLHQQLRIKDEKIRELEDMLRIKDDEISNLRSHLDKFQSVFPLYMLAAGSSKHLGLNNNVGGMRPRKQRAGISAEPQSDQTLHDLSQLPTYDKEETSRDLIRDAIMDNDFMKYLDITQIREIVDCMYPELHKAGSLIIKEGDVGSIVYVLEG